MDNHNWTFIQFILQGRSCGSWFDITHDLHFIDLYNKYKKNQSHYDNIGYDKIRIISKRVEMNVISEFNLENKDASSNDNQA